MFGMVKPEVWDFLKNNNKKIFAGPSVPVLQTSLETPIPGMKLKINPKIFYRF